MTYTYTRSAEFCGCDPGAGHLCEQHKLKEIKDILYWFLKNSEHLEPTNGKYFQRYDDSLDILMEWSTS